MRNQVDCFHVDTNQNLLLVDTNFFGGSIQACPKNPKGQVCYTLAIVQEKDEE